jgi:4-diphosphocytidyl-2-C-methyl-D-erythritol kinase
VIAFPNAKINLGLHVIEKRADGFHNIETIFYPIGWCDILEIVKSDSLKFKKTGIRISGESKKNLCLQAYQLLKDKYDLPPVNIHLHKIIPIGAGLGGGSSDAAHTLLLLNKIFDLAISETDLIGMASTIGADCAFFIKNNTVFATGKGDVFETVDLKLPGLQLLVVKPDVGVNTASAYKGVKPKLPLSTLKETVAKPAETWKEVLANDFETTVFKKQPVIQYIKEELYNSGAVYASMSGSGSAVYGLFKTTDALLLAKDKLKIYSTWSG